jgi:probable HAF family extracellular repeat protein
MLGNTQRLIFTSVFGLMLFTTRSAAQSFNFNAIDVPCSATLPTSCPNGIARQTVANGINPAGDIVGVFTDGVGKQHGFLLSGGQFTTIDFPGAVATSANGIGPSGDIVGNYTAPYIPGVSDSTPADSPEYCPAAGSPACIKGLLYRHGKFSSVLFAGHPGAITQRITPDGDIYGCLHDFDLMNSMFGAVWGRIGESSLTANGGELADPSHSMPMSMNNGATPGGHMIVGHWTDMSNHRHGFVVQDGVFQSYDVSGSTLTAIWDINPGQEFVGTYVESTGHRHGFLQLPDGSAPINVDYPGAATTVAFGINPDGVIVGQYSAAGRTHGFVAVPVSSN